MALASVLQKRQQVLEAGYAPQDGRVVLVVDILLETKLALIVLP